MKIVFTGPAKVGGVRIIRRDLEAMASKVGWQVQSMVSNDTDLVVASNNNFKGRHGRKLSAADRLGVRCVTPDTFVKMAKRGGAR